MELKKSGRAKVRAYGAIGNRVPVPVVSSSWYLRPGVRNDVHPLEEEK